MIQPVNKLVYQRDAGAQQNTMPQRWDHRPMRVSVRHAGERALGR
jgi:hypothetical protein